MRFQSETSVFKFLRRGHRPGVWLNSGVLKNSLPILELSRELSVALLNYLYIVKTNRTLSIRYTATDVFCTCEYMKDHIFALNVNRCEIKA